ncbi:hypothetical protein E6H18_07350 [Candidatus Bathyarchaeota archaeon]|nr:MAG: hypothetical protein E6H20_00955 [Candidatus Bathyarchaeota archaeon]TMI56438.1 MAG: hypothetical protein E6H18_07350 [Candidatus Bathyarchaeota archaeon]
MVSHETTRILGISSLVFILILLLARSLPFPFPGSQPATFPRIHGDSNGYVPTLIFSHTVSFTGPTPTFNLTLIQFHSYMWRFNVTAGSVKISLTDPKTGIIFWTVGSRSSGQWHLNGTGLVRFNWTAPVSTSYSMVIENQNLSPWSSSGFLSTSPYFSCDIHVWDLDTPTPPPVIVW